MLNDITIVKCEVMSHLVRLRGKDTVQRAHCALKQTIWREFRCLAMPVETHSGQEKI